MSSLSFATAISNVNTNSTDIINDTIAISIPHSMVYRAQQRNKQHGHFPLSEIELSIVIQLFISLYLKHYIC